MILLLCSALVTSPGLSNDRLTMPSAFVANYKISKGNMASAMVLSLARDGRWWRFESRSEPTGMLSLFSGAHAREVSILEQHDELLRPAAYNYMAGKEPSERDVASFFDWQRGQIVSTRGNDPLSVQLPRGAVDRLTILLELGRRLRAGERDMTIPVAARGKIRNRRYVLEGTEELRLPAGKVEAMRVKEVREPGKRYTLSWFAAEHGYLPVRIDQFRKGKRQGSFELRSIEWL